MNQIERSKFSRSFFYECIIPLAEYCRAHNIQFFESADASAQSYFIDSNDVQNMEQRFAASPEAFIREMANLWHAQGFVAFAELLPRLLDLAHQMTPDEERQEDPPPFIYTMF